MRQTAMLAADFRPFAWLGRQFFKFTYLPLQSFALEQYVFCIVLEFFALSGRGAPFFLGNGYCCGTGKQASLCIKQHALRIRFQ